MSIPSSVSSIAAFLLVCVSAASPAQSPAADAADAAFDAQLAATQATLAGTAEGLYRGCKSSRELRSGRPSEPNLVLAFDLASECEVFAQGVAATVAITHPFSFGGNCSINGPVEPDQLIDSIVQVVDSNPLLIGSTSSRQLLTFQALKLVSQCQANEG